MTASGSTVTVQNVGGFAIPFDMAVTYTDGSTATLHQSPAIWQANQKQATIALPKAVKSVSLQRGRFYGRHRAGQYLDAALGVAPAPVFHAQRARIKLFLDSMKPAG